MKKIILLTLLLTTAQLNAAGAKVIELILTETGIIKTLTQKGFQAANAKAAQSQIKLAINSIIGSSEVPSKKSLITAIAAFESNPENNAVKRQLATILNKSEEHVKKEDLISLINNLILLAGVKGSLVTACGQCAAGPLASEGVNFALKEITDQSVIDTLAKNAIPNSPRDISRFISGKMKRYNLGEFSRVSLKQVPKTDWKTLAIFLAMSDKTSKASSVQRDFIKAVSNFSKEQDGKVNLLNPANPHKFWNAFTDSDIDEALLSELTIVLNRAASEASNPTSRKTAFYDVLQKRADSIEDPKQRKLVQDKIDSIKQRNCFFSN